AGFGQPDTARGADEERRAEPRLECAHRLADRRWSHPEFRGCSAKAAVLSSAQERLYTVERALPDCEVLLHTLPTLSRIVGRRKRPYVCGEDLKPLEEYCNDRCSRRRARPLSRDRPDRAAEDRSG